MTEFPAWRVGGGARLQKTPRHPIFFLVFLRHGVVQPLILSGVPRTLVVENKDAFLPLRRATKGAPHVHGWLLQ